MLKESQKIIYRRNGKEIAKITSETPLNIMGRGLIGYIRFYQPFTKPGWKLNIPVRGEKGEMRELMTTKARYVTRKDNTLVVETKNSTYEIQYEGIDLEKVLNDGEWCGVNKDTDDWSVREFP